MENNGLTGLVNLGNTCLPKYSIQCLLMVTILNKILKDKIDNNNLNNNIESLLVTEWINLYDLMWSSNCIIKPDFY